MNKEYIYENKQWYSMDIEKVYEELGTKHRFGLTNQEAKNRLEKFGRNELAKKKKRSAILRFLAHFNDTLIYVLLAAAVVTTILGHYVDTAVIVIVAVVNAVIGFFQENKAEKALDNIKKMLSLKAQIVREGVRFEIDAVELTIGDIVLLEPGNKAPADLRLVRTANLKMEEAALTGESVPSEKNVKTLLADTSLGDRDNMVFSSTSVTAGTGVGLVVAIGEETEIGKINHMLNEVDKVTTPLIKQTTAFSKAISITIVAIAALVFAFGYFFRSYDVSELLLSCLGLAIAAIPEGLPAILSIILAIGVQAMAKKKAIIRSLPSVETLGSVTVICSDKTGTLTKNEMTVKTVQTCCGEFETTGTGYAPEGEILQDGKPIDYKKEPVFCELVNAFNICNDASLSKDDDEGHWSIHGDPTDGALLTLYQKAALEHVHTNRLHVIPFDSEYKYMAVLVESEGKDKNLILIKGAPDRLLDMAQQEKNKQGVQEIDRAFWEEKIHTIAEKGQRMIGAAYKVVDKSVSEISHKDVEKDIIFLGLAGIIDPPREEAIGAIKVCKQAGIRVKMITGDHVTTAQAIGREMGIGDRAIEGKKLEKMSDEEFADAAQNYDIFARTSPENKLRLVEALQSRGEVCAMTGDGVNDAPALKKSDVGIAMGIKGTEVTKDAAEMVLADDNFATIVTAVEEGRRVYDNLKKTILFILPTNGAESFLIVASILFGTMMPLTPVQILFVNMVTSVTISLALAFEKAEPGIMRRPPRSAKSPLLSGYFIWRIIFVSVLIGGGTLWLNVDLLHKGVSEDIVRTITLQTIVITQMFHLFNSRSIRQPAFRDDFFSNTAIWVVCALLVVLQLSVTYLPFMNSLFGTVPLLLKDWWFPFTAGITVFIVIEIEKSVMRAWDRRKKAKEA